MDADPLSRLLSAAAGPRQSLLRHPVYERLSDLEALRSFMGAHVFAVWDFMSLLKTLQRQLTCVEVPWLPAADTECARMINEIVLGEETDEVRPGQYQSHFDLYREAMREVGAEDGAVLRFVESLRAGRSLEAALAHAPPEARPFVRHTLDSTRLRPHEVAAAFLLGRESLLPSVFERILAAVRPLGAECSALRLYLERHIQLDGEEHGVRAEQLLRGLCGEDPERWREARASALSALHAREALWDGVLRALASEPTPRGLASVG
ncbi:MAG: DUF3050 domain-containing protein [Cystobacter sp.]